MRVDLVSVAREIGTQLNPCLPDGCWLEVEADDYSQVAWLRTYTREGEWAASGLLDFTLGPFERNQDPLTTDESNLAETVREALSGVQDDIVYASRGERWPKDPLSEDPLPSAWARLDDSQLSYGYGSLTIGAFDLKSVQAGP